MLKRKAIPVGTLFMILVLALAFLGVGYGLWSKLLKIDGTINTGEVNAIFYDAFTDDDNVGDGDPCPIVSGGSCDPSGFVEEFGQVTPRVDKDVGICTAEISAEGQTLTVIVEKGYPSYHCTVWFDILNDGTIPLKIQSLSVNPVGGWTNGEQVTVALSELSCGQQIDPGLLPSGEVVTENIAQGDIHIHVEQAAEQNAAYTFDAQLFLVQWNEFKPCP